MSCLLLGGGAPPFSPEASRHKPLQDAAAANVRPTTRAPFRRSLMALLDPPTDALDVRTDPVEVGFDPARLDRVGRRLQRFVDEGSLPGFLVTVSRHGRLVRVARGGSRDVERR